MLLEVDCHSPQATLECPHQAGTGLELGTLFFFFFFIFTILVNPDRLCLSLGWGFRQTGVWPMKS